MLTLADPGGCRVDERHLVTLSTVPDVECQITFFSNGQPSGHLDFTDFDDLARTAWGIARAVRPT